MYAQQLLFNHMKNAVWFWNLLIVHGFDSSDNLLKS